MTTSEIIIIVLTGTNVLIFLAIFFVTLWYAKSTRAIAIKTSESVEITRKHIEVINNLRKDELTYKLIREWLDEEKFLSYKIEKCDIKFDSEGRVSNFDNIKAFRFMDYFYNFFDYFTLVHKLITSNNINIKFFLL